MTESKSNEELVEKIFPCPTPTGEILKVELLSLLAKGRAAMELVENLKYCANCKSFDGENYCELFHYNKRSKNVCPNWQSDQLTRKEREGV